MVLINELTVEQINAALLHLQRSKDEVVGGNKGTTIQNISVNNSGGGGNNVDYSGTIKLLARNIEANKDAIDKNTSDISSLKDDMKNIEKSVEETLQGLADNGISDLSFDPLTKQLTITTNNEDTYQTTIEQDIGYLSYDNATNKLTLTTGNQTQEITLPYIKTSEKGSANGVATLDENGRVPYSQLPESAMEFLGQWDASTNTPHLADGTGTNGDFYIVSTGGTVNLGTTQNPHIITFSVNDRIVYEGDIAQWVRLPAGQVSSVNGQSGEVVLTASDINYSTGVTIKDKIDANAVQANWNETDTSKLSYIQNKPTIPDAQIQSDWAQTDNTKKDFIKNKPSLATVATSGSYTDLSNKPTIPAAQIQSDWTCTSTSSKAFIKNKPTLATVATSGSYDDLSNKPTIPAAQVNSDWNATTGVAQILNKPTIPAAQIQSDWTQTNNACKDYIKNKPTIPTVTDVIENGNQNAASSNAVASALDVPTDAVLHYSFDEVPDYPDGSADVRLIDNNTYDLQSGNYKFVNSGGTTFTNNNGKLQCVTESGGYWEGFYINKSYTNNKVIKMKFKITALSGNVLLYMSDDLDYKTFSSVGEYEISCFAKTVNSNFSFVIRTGNSATIIIDEIYIGDGSYSTPIIDNANGQNNATNNGGIAVQGVSGKGAYFLEGKYADLGTNFQIPSNFSISLWINPSNNTTNKREIIIGKSNSILLFNGANNDNNLIMYFYSNSQSNRYLLRQGLLTPNVWHFVVITKNGTQLKCYINGVLVNTLTCVESIDQNSNSFNIGFSTNERSGTKDDFQIFDRALSEQEVQALYLNKANTPKYYDINNYDIKNADTTPTQNSNALITSGAVYNATQGKVSMADVSNGVVPVALCSGSSSVGKSTGCSLTFDPSTGTLDAAKFSGLAKYVCQLLGCGNRNYDVALLEHSGVGTGFFNQISYACCRTIKYNPSTCTLCVGNVCASSFKDYNGNQFITGWTKVYENAQVYFSELGNTGIYKFFTCQGNTVGSCIWDALLTLALCVTGASPDNYWEGVCVSAIGGSYCCLGSGRVCFLPITYFQINNNSASTDRFSVSRNQSSCVCTKDMSFVVTSILYN